MAASSVSIQSSDVHQIRPLQSAADFQACLRLQRETWGEHFSETVPPSILMVCQRIGGVAAGAFSAEGRLDGFVFGLTGVERGRLVHWSDMLAVRPEVRNLGIGRRLKEFQRRTVAALGVELIYWTYDPLVARNAHLNLNRLGAEVTEYVQDMYGESDSVLHRGLGTDRFVVAWSVHEASGRVRPAPAPEAVDQAPVLNPAGSVPPALPAAPLVRIEIPPDIQAVQNTSMEEAARWRASTREAFLTCLERGYRVDGVFREARSGRCFYLLSHS